MATNDTAAISLGPPPLPILTPEQEAESNTEWLVGVASAIFALAMVSIGLRLYTRLKIIGKAGWDDLFMFMAGLAEIAGMILFGLTAQHGMGKHVQIISSFDQIELQKLGFFQSLIPNSGGLWMMKMSLGFSLVKLSREKWYKHTIIGFMVFVSATTIFAWGTIIGFCQPVSGWWDKSAPDLKCYSLKMFLGFALFHTANNMFTDVVFAVLPIPIIWMLQMHKRVKIYLIGIMSLGWICVGMGVLKAFYQIKFGGDQDGTFQNGIMFWSFVQVNTSIITASLPTLKPLVGKALKLTSYASRYGYGGGGGRKSTYGMTSEYARSKNRPHPANGDYIRSQNESYFHHDVPDAKKKVALFGGGDIELNERHFPTATGSVRVEGGGSRSHLPAGGGGLYALGDDVVTSEEMILQGATSSKHAQAEAAKRGGGIVRTTEIRVQR